ncbi:chemotaxis protein CheB [Swingsia samuiensis]|uniref:histidine kinase n=1 Tax=Swingsia samuiensis TaxID=1293412 RepID=A0A4Y6UHQ5_9PROT|nr:chemotaxis protein CheB [Swingsia samuiensis]QDH17129.1 chemotaxis protein [Swingsia samuiensis]
MNTIQNNLPLVVGVGASAGGLEALRLMLSSIKKPTKMAFVVVQHLDPHHNSLLAQLLERYTELTVLQSEGGELLQADHVYIIPPGHGLKIQNSILKLTDFTRPRGLRRPIDDFFVSLANDQQSNAACVILSGTGADGTTGVRAIKENGGVCIVQQPDTARYDGMPLSAVGTGLVDFVKPPEEIFACLKDFLDRRTLRFTDADSDVLANNLDAVCRELRMVVGHDFSGYKHSTLIRRIARRMHVVGIDSPHEYLLRMQKDHSEAQALFRDLLINVTKFFRDTDAFEQLRLKVIEPLVLNRGLHDDIRVWVAGCSSGEEAYSIAILFAEALRIHECSHNVQIFASDIDEQMLSIARAATYPNAALIDIPEHLRERYTVPVADRFKISNHVRNMVRFSNHSLLKDPPFSKVDLLSCRNLLIYFEENLQKAIVPILHYAVRPNGYLFLGPSDSIGRFEGFFSVAHQQARIFEKLHGGTSHPIALPTQQYANPTTRPSELFNSDRKIQSDTAASQRLLELYTPPSLVVNKDGEIISAFGKLGIYFDFPVTRTGGSSIFTLARPGLRGVIGQLLRQTQQALKRTIIRDVDVLSEFTSQKTDVICDPLGEDAFLLVFQNKSPAKPISNQDIEEFQTNNNHVEILEDELRLMRHRLRLTIEELETANEELKSSNEEMMSMNEELQSANEELSTVNDELKTKITQLTVANSDLKNFFDSTNAAVVVVDENLCIRNYTEAATFLFPLKPGDKGRPFADVSGQIELNDYLQDTINVTKNGEVISKRVIGINKKHIYSLRIMPYRTQGESINGATLVFTDITDALYLERQLASERERLELAIRAARIGVWEYSPQKKKTVLDVGNQTLVDISTFHSESHAWISSQERSIITQTFDNALESGEPFDINFSVHQSNGETRWVRASGHFIANSSPPTLIGVSIDVTPEHEVVETRELMVREMNHRVKNLFAVISSMISIAAHRHNNVRVFAKDMRTRIVALGIAHSCAAQNGFDKGTNIQHLIKDTLAPYQHDNNIKIFGPPVLINYKNLSPLALLLHEWATNSVKYGALNINSEGTLHISWREQHDNLIIYWKEQKKNEITFTGSSGFGEQLEQTALRQLKATIERHTTPLRFEMKITLPRMCFSNE